MKFSKIILIILVVLFTVTVVSAVELHKLYTTDGLKYEGRVVGFRYGNIRFNVYKFGKLHKSIHIPLYKVWKLVINQPDNKVLDTSFEIEQKYKKLRKNKRRKRVQLSANKDWLDTRITIRDNTEFLFTITGNIYIDAKTLVTQNGELELKWHKDKPLPTHSTGSVIGKIGMDGKPFYIGNNRAPFKVDKGGKLYLGINDNSLQDNSGNFIVMIYY